MAQLRCWTLLRSIFYLLEHARISPPQLCVRNWNFLEHMCTILLLYCVPCTNLVLLACWYITIFSIFLLLGTSCRITILIFVFYRIVPICRWELYSVWIQNSLCISELSDSPWIDPLYCLIHGLHPNVRWLNKEVVLSLWKCDDLFVLDRSHFVKLTRSVDMTAFVMLSMKNKERGPYAAQVLVDKLQNIFYLLIAALPVFFKKQSCLWNTCKADEKAQSMETLIPWFHLRGSFFNLLNMVVSLDTCSRGNSTAS